VVGVVCALCVCDVCVCVIYKCVRIVGGVGHAHDTQVGREAPLI
jgi:hypothetical protein